MKEYFFKEACVSSLYEAIQAEKKGADQIELCIRLDLDGNSPPISLVKQVCNGINIPIKVIVNPIPFRYVYNIYEHEEIKKYVLAIQQFPISGIVFGPLTIEGNPDIEALKSIREICSLPITYHKAIDETDRLSSVAILKDSKLVDFILSSGGNKTAQEGKMTILEMKTHLLDSNIELIAAGRITDQNLDDLHACLGLNYYHGKLIVGSL